MDNQDVNKRDQNMQEIREVQALQGSLRQSRQKKTIRKTNSPSNAQSNGGCFSIFKCCDNSAQRHDPDQKIERKLKKKPKQDSNQHLQEDHN